MGCSLLPRPREAGGRSGVCGLAALVAPCSRTAHAGIITPVFVQQCCRLFNAQDLEGCHAHGLLLIKSKSHHHFMLICVWRQQLYLCELVCSGSDYAGRWRLRRSVLF